MKQNFVLTFVAVLALSLLITACGGGGQVVERIVTVEVEKIVTVEVEKEVEKIVTVEVEAEVGEAAAAAEPTEAPAAEETTAETAAPAAQAGESTLDIVRERGTLLCGGNANVPGFGYLDPDTNEYAGFDIDYCRAVAAAVLGDADAVEVRATSGTDRFPVLQSGEVDLLVRNTTWTISRDTALGFNFAPTTFYDGQGMMVRKDSGIEDLEDLEGGTICVQQGTTTEKNLADVFRALDVSYEPVVLPDSPSTTAAYDEGRCDGFTTDKSALLSQLPLLANADDHVILEVTMSKEPLGPLVRHGDDQWFDIVQWTVFATFAAEELGVTSANVDDLRDSTGDPNILKLLGGEGEMGAKLGLSNDWSYNVVKQVGNYGEIYDRNLGPDTPTFIPRGVNNLWTNGGIIYAPPIR